MSQLLETLLQEGFDALEYAKNCTPRQFSFPESENIIKVAIGMRRTGKTYFLYQKINELLSSGVQPSQILMINFEDDRLLPMNAKQMGELLDSFYTLYPENHNRICYFFLDEVQNVEDWHLVVRRYFDSHKVQLFLTGSSAKLLSSEINTSLRGRSLATEIWPYSFQEYLAAHQISQPEKPFGKKTQDIMQEHLLNYFTWGGFPAVQAMPKNEWLETLQGYVDTVILRDIVERHNVSNVMLLKYLASTLLKNAASPFSVNKFYNAIKSQGYKVSKDTIYTYIKYIEDTFLAFSVEYYSESERKKQNNPKKIYAIDNGLLTAHSLRTNDIYNKFLENQIYLDLRRQKKDVFYYKTSEGYEVDFVAVDKEGNRELIQVTWDMSNTETEDREKRALHKAEQELGIKGRIITMSDYLRDHILQNKL